MSTLELWYPDGIFSVQADGFLGVQVDERTFIGTGASQIQNPDYGSESLFFAGKPVSRRTYNEGSIPTDRKRAFEFLHKNEQLEYAAFNGRPIYDVDVDSE